MCEAKWQKKKGFLNQSLLRLKPDVGPHVKAKVRQQNSCWYIVLQDEPELDSASEFCLFFKGLWSQSFGSRPLNTHTQNPMSVRRHQKSVKNRLVLLFGEVSEGFPIAGSAAGFSWVVTGTDVLLRQLCRGSALRAVGCACVWIRLMLGLSVITKPLPSRSCGSAENLGLQLGPTSWRWVLWGDWSDSSTWSHCHAP